SDLMGSKMAIGNLEMRIPFTGPKELAVMESGFLFSDLNIFIDGGVAWNRGNKVKMSKSDSDRVEAIDGDGNPIIGSDGKPVMVYDSNVKAPVFSAGVSLRINLFGAMILEPYYAIPFQRSDVKFGVFGLNFAPGW
ncbi:MAG TPA: tolB protein precursor, partial [Candidatus Sphingobacterium stercoripullorum]|nr:tolB protein precursor [Candidatus Sphingobacterium stercoripullorum]